MNMISFILYYISQHSGAEYIQDLVNLPLAPLDKMHEEAMRRLEYLDEFDQGAVPRKSAHFHTSDLPGLKKSSHWKYSIGWGGTKIVIDDFTNELDARHIQITIFSYAYDNETRKTVTKGAVSIMAHPTEYFYTQAWTVKWDCKVGKGHSWGRLKDLKEMLDRDPTVNVEHINYPEEVEAWDWHSVQKGGF